jgi:aminoacrylate hydrolase
VSSYPLAPRVHRVDGLHVEAWGDPTAPALLLSAGLGGQGGYWTPHLRTLAARHYVVAYDQRGTGESDRAIPSPFKLTDMADDLRLVLDGLSIACAHVMGHAAGGMAAMRLALDHPERVRSAIVINGWDAPDPYFVRCMDIRANIMRTQGVAAYLAVQPLFLYPAEWTSTHLNALDRQTAAHGPQFQSADTLFARMAALIESDMVAELSGLSCPVLLISALDDMLVPAVRLTMLADALVGSAVTHAVSATGGHAVNITRQEWFEGQVLTFLNTLAS